MVDFWFCSSVTVSMKGKSEALTSPRVGRLGELHVEMALVQQRWHPVRLDTAQMASNADLLAVNQRHRIAIQVKTTDADKDHSHSKWLGFGYSTGYVRDQKSIFNSKASPLIADVVVGVSYKASGPRFIVMPVVVAERLCRDHCDYWSQIKTRTEHGKRSDSYPIYLCFLAPRENHLPHDERIQRNLGAFENRWDILMDPIDKLHDERAWKLLK